MQKEFMDQWASMGKDAMKPSLGFYSLTTRVLETLTRNNLELLNHCVANSLKQFQAVGTGKIECITQLSAENNSKFVDKFVLCTQQNLEAIRQASNDFNKMIEETVHNVAKDVIKKPMQTGAKAEA